MDGQDQRDEKIERLTAKLKAAEVRIADMQIAAARIADKHQGMCGLPWVRSEGVTSDFRTDTIRMEPASKLVLITPGGKLVSIIADSGPEKPSLTAGEREIVEAARRRVATIADRAERALLIGVLSAIDRIAPPPLPTQEEQWAQRIIECCNSNTNDARDDLYRVVKELRERSEIERRERGGK